MRHALEIWQIVSRHQDLGETLERITPLASADLDFDVLAVRRLERQHARLETLASMHADGRPAMHLLASVEPEEVAALAQQLRTASLLEPGQPGFVALSPWPSARQLAVLPVEVEPGLVLVLANRRKTFEASTLARAGALVAALAVAVENDRRLHELARFKEASNASANRARLQGPLDETIVGASQGLRHVMSQVVQVARTDAPVLLLGETGSGKEVIARAIHERSPRASGPLVRVNCGAIPTELIDSVLFGHEKGAFTGATATHRGWFERADGGTLFLDEVAELPQAAQVRLLRVLQEGTFERVGAQRPMHVDVRIVAATHRDMPTLVEQGAFRADLWYRLGVFPLTLPALRDRQEDLPELARHFARRSAERLGVSSLVPTSANLERLARYAWPGNVRELAAVIERAAILGHGLRLDIDAALGTPRPTLVPAAPAVSGPVTDVAHLDEAMVRHIERALERTRGRIEGPNGAAALLQINPHTLRSRMRKLGIDWDRFRRLAAG